jgi:branched-chain amino acid transport system substrate-binding protein
MRGHRTKSRRLQEETMTRRTLASGPSRRALVKGGLLSATTAFFGPWQHNRVWAQGTKPIKLGLTCDASGQYGNSGQDDLRGIRLAIDEFNAKGGVLGRKVEWITADTETNPATGTRVAERFIAQEQCGFLVGALHSGVANAITQVANKYGTIYFNTNSSAPSEAGENCQIRLGRQRHQLLQGRRAERCAEDRQEMAAADQ